MNAKNRLIEKLLKVAKKHKILTYPVLALVAVISVFHYFFSWSTGAGKRVVAVVMVLVMLVSQSYFLTSSATALVDTEETVQEQKELQEQNDDLVETQDDSTVNEDDLVETENNTEVATEGETQDGPVDVVGTTETATDETTTDETTTDETTTEVVTDDGTTEDASTETSVYVDDTTEQTDTAQETPTYSDEEVKDAEQADGEDVRVDVIFVANKHDSSPEVHRTKAVKNDGEDTYKIESPTWEADANKKLATNHNDGDYLQYEGWYTTKDYSVKVDSSLADKLSLSEAGTIWLYAKEIISNYKVSVSSTGTVSYTVSGATQDPNATGVYAVPTNNNSGTFTIVNPQRAGYKIAGIDASSSSNGVSAVVSGDDLVVTLSGKSYIQNVALAWEAEDYDIQYQTADGLVTQTVTYDGQESSDLIYSDKDVTVAPKDGYVFAGWETNGGAIQISKEEAGSIFVASKSALQSYAYSCAKSGTPAVLTPYYDYAGVELLKNQVTYEYKKPQTEPVVISAVYKNNGKSSDTFQYAIGKITDGSGTEVDPADYGLDINAGAKAVTVVTGADGPQEVATLKVEVNITDSAVTEDDKKTTKQELTIVINPRNLELDTSAISELTKVYDGTTDCEFTGEIPTNVDGVTVVISSSRFDSANAGQRTVLLTRPASDWLNGDDIKNYKINVNADGDFEVNGTIKQREVNVRTSAVLPDGRSYVRAGEVNPQFVAQEIATDEENKGLIEADKNRLNELITLTTDPERDDSGMTTSRDDTYRVVPADTADSNYKFNFNYSDLGTFKVRLEAADSLFDAIGKTESGWYGEGSKIIPKSDSGYNQIRGAAGSEADEIILTEENTAGEKITFQLYDSVTGAYTAFTTFPVKVDLTKPEFVSCEVIENGIDTGDGLFFPSAGGQVSLGHYYNKSITFRVSYKDTGSGANKLIYSLSGNLTDASDAAGQEISFVTRNDGIAVFTFTIPVRELMDQKGGIQFYAKDAAENTSELLNLCQAGDEWIVEQTAPSIDVIIKAGGSSSTDGITITGEDQDTYYGKVKAYLSATDNTSPITSITWIVNGKEYVKNLNDEKLQVSDTLPINATSFVAQEDGVFTVSAYVTDKAGNDSLTTTPITFKIDDVQPVVTINDGYDSYQKEVKLEFNAYDELSGVKYINVKDLTTGEMIQHKVDKVEKNEDGYTTSYCYIQTTKKGNYTIEVSDNAGNVFTETIVLDKVSSEVPPCPSVTFTPEVNENGWITVKDAKAVITNITKTENDDTPVDTKYKLWLDGEDARNITVIDKDSDTEEIMLSVLNPLIDEEGIYTLSVWSQSATGVLCNEAEETHGHEFTVKIDTEKPVISEPSFKSKGKTLTVTFEVTDETSGVDAENVKVMNGTREVALKSLEPNEDETGYIGTFEVTTVGDYSIIASDIAGNVAEELAFRPMSLRVHEVQDLSYNEAFISAFVKKGTFDVSKATIAYGKFGDDIKDYKQAVTTDEFDEMGNLTVSAKLTGLEPDTNYVFMVVATSAQGEELTGTGQFKTPAKDAAGITITGTARYSNTDKEGTITVGLFDGDVCVDATVVDTIKDTPRDESFTFENVPDGNYNLVAKDGNYTQTVKVTIKDGTLLSPETNHIDLVLSGLSTSVEITTDDTPHISVDFNNIFNDSVNYTDEDKALVESGLGCVEFKLYATVRYVEEVSADEKEAMYAVRSVNGKLVGAYIDLSLVKIVTDEDGVETRTQVHTLGNGANVSVTIPLTEFLIKQNGKVVVGIHNKGSVDKPSYVARVYDPDYDTNPATYTFEANSFSTFALLYDPLKQESTTEEIKDGTMDPSDDGTIHVPDREPSTEDIDEDDEEELPNKKPNKNEKEDKDDSDGKGSSVGSLKSSGSAKTGDASPLASVFGLMLLASCALVFIRKKAKTEV